jgi:hypothetical protein
MRLARTPSAGARRLGGGRGAAQLTANFLPIEDAKANFFGAHGDVVSGAVSLAAGDAPQTLLELPGESISLSAAASGDQAIRVTIHNRTAVPLEGAQHLDGATTPLSLAAHGDASITLTGRARHRLHVQIFPHRPQFPSVVTVLVGSGHESGMSLVGQAFLGAV